MSLDNRAALVRRVFLAGDQTIALHAGQHACQARAQQEGFFGDTAGLQRLAAAQHAQHPPLLVRQAMRAQKRPRVSHDGFPCLQKQTG